METLTFITTFSILNNRTQKEIKTLDGYVTGNRIVNILSDVNENFDREQ